MAEPLRKVTLQGEHGCPPGQRVATSPLDVEATVERLKEGIGAEDLWVIAVVDPQMLLAKGGYAIPATRQVLFFHPRYMARLLAANAAGIVEAPLKFVVMETGAGVLVRYPEPLSTLGRYEGLADLAAELSEVVRRIATGLGTSHRDGAGQDGLALREADPEAV